MTDKHERKEYARFRKQLSKAIREDPEIQEMLQEIKQALHGTAATPQGGVTP